MENGKTKQGQLIQINDNTYVAIPGSSVMVKTEPPYADIPVEITVYTVKETVLTVRKINVSKEEYNNIDKIPSLNKRIDELIQLINMNNSSNNIGIPDGTIYINGTGNDPYYEESHRCYQEIGNIKTSVEERLDNSNTSQSSEELPVEQYKLQGIEPIEFIKTLEKLKKELKLAEIQDEKIRTDFANKAVTGYCKATEKFYRNKEDLKQASILKVVGWSLLLVIINFILSRTLNLAELVSSANLTGVFNFLVALSPLAVIGGISFIEYVQYEAKDGELISAYAQKNGELLEKLKSERNKISNNQLTIPKGLGYHPNPETEYKLPPKDTAIVNRLNKQQLLRLKDALLGTRRTQKITNHPKKPEGHMKVLKPNSTNKPQE